MNFDNIKLISCITFLIYQKKMFPEIVYQDVQIHFYILAIESYFLSRVI